jgi:hypothetical protein
MIVARERDSERLLDLTVAHVMSFDAVNFGTLFNRLQRLRRREISRDVRFLECVAQLERMCMEEPSKSAKKFSAFSCAMIAHGLGYFNVYSEPFFRMIDDVRVSKRLVDEGQPQSLSRLVCWRMNLFSLQFPHPLSHINTHYVVFDLLSLPPASPPSCSTSVALAKIKVGNQLAFR